MKLLLSRLSLVLIGLITAGLILTLTGLRINTSNSIPKGLYWISAEKNLKNQYVIFCPKDTELFREALHRGFINKGFCPGGFGYLMKKVVALEGDFVSSTETGVFVNDKLLPMSKPQMVITLQEGIQNYLEG